MGQEAELSNIQKLSQLLSIEDENRIKELMQQAIKEKNINTRAIIKYLYRIDCERCHSDEETAKLFEIGNERAEQLRMLGQRLLISHLRATAESQD